MTFVVGNAPLCLKCAKCHLLLWSCICTPRFPAWLKCCVWSGRVQKLSEHFFFPFSAHSFLNPKVSCSQDLCLHHHWVWSSWRHLSSVKKKNWRISIKSLHLPVVLHSQVKSVTILNILKWRLSTRSLLHHLLYFKKQVIIFFKSDHFERSEIVLRVPGTAWLLLLKANIRWHSFQDLWPG